ncbi:MAG: TetR/AcrR family transcriptional regulator [Gammaproteobacteria bacterium]|nr:TetR/AcrR family transcriptional regulator [Gammaproteobacteria bacterium]
MATHPAGKVDDLNNRMRLLHAAADAFAQTGYEGTSLRTIADKAGVSFQLISYYFGSKEDLWSATVEFLYDRNLQAGTGFTFDTRGDIHAQFRSQLRTLLDENTQRPQLRKIWIQELLAGGGRYEKYVHPKLKQLTQTLSLPFFSEAVRLGIITRFTPQEAALVWASIVQMNVVSPYYTELMLDLPINSAKSLEHQVDLIYHILTEARPAKSTAVLPVETAEVEATTDLAVENLHLKQIIGGLMLEKKVLLDSLAQREAD